MSDAAGPTPPVGPISIACARALAVLISAISLAGITYPATYARETQNWAAQALGQDWVDLLFAVPWLILTAAAARRGSRSGVLLLAGGLAYASYELVIYAFAVHFNAFFLLYCAALGLAVSSLLFVVHALLRADVRAWFADTTRVRAAGIFLVAVGLCFALLWLSEIVPALARGSVPASIVVAGVPTNPVYALDLSLVLPAHVAAGVLLLRRHPLGFVAAPIVLAFGVLMAASIGGMVLVMFWRGAAADASVAGAMAVLSGVTALFLVRLLRSLR